MGTVTRVRAGLVVAAALVLAGCSGGGGLSAIGSTSAKPPAPAAKLTAAPLDGAKGVTVNTPVTLTADGGTIKDVKLVDATGKAVEGKPAADGKPGPTPGSWTSGRPTPTTGRP